MEDLAKDWKKLSLSTKEDYRFDLSKKQKVQNYVLAAKFFTRRVLNIEAVAKTFRPLWRTRGKFEVNDIGENIFSLLSRMRTLKRSSWVNHGLLINTWWFSEV